ncbi:dipeptidase [Croceibacter atlanticus]|jgi:membrane dipeptidase|uniref:Dipeptidase n=1 Tax=Croceibacter atlanticus (strain ATCC BAA-628 / JCM 21780 / CIP 108009 / IAM 15332 / KCTC 12090 / HTCC2559) TaxID=216432 RepID=A3U9Y9_CROAH|nr:dipeptidase [Croceibacter atlanticus]EAP86625.1 dipeptidase [Croceibacter atlanticus HTCC2559]MBW4970905.1 dipeptidase [Croceibacter atlanticus]
MRNVLSLVLLVFISISCKDIEPKELTENQLLAKAMSIHLEVITLDTHCDINIRNFTDSINYTQNLETQVNLPNMKEGGLDVAWFIVYTGQDSLNDIGYKNAYDNAIRKFEAIHRLVDSIAPNDIALATTSKEVKDIHESGKLVAMIGIENGYPIGTDLSNVKTFYDMGARYMSLSHNGHSQLSDSNTGEKDGVWLHNGLSELGKEVVSEMNRVGMMIDVSHPSKEAMRQMINLTEAPIIASHSSARALCDHSRNLDDEQLQWLKENNGVVQTVAFSSYLNTEKHNAFNDAKQKLYKSVGQKMGFEIIERDSVRLLDNEARTAYYDNYRKVINASKEKVEALKQEVAPVNVSDFADHIDYLVEKIGISHVGISSDFDGGGGIHGWEDASETFNVTLELVRRGYTQKEIEMLWSGNLLRVLDDVEAVSKRIQEIETEVANN